jgi:polyadenylation factor subunit 2
VGVGSQSDRPQAEVFGHSRDRAVWGLSWHPLGHVLASVGHDHMAKFWARGRPGNPLAGDANEYEHSSLIGEAATHSLRCRYFVCL